MRARDRERGHEAELARPSSHSAVLARGGRAHARALSSFARVPRVGACDPVSICAE